jgi:hypothetical protein
MSKLIRTASTRRLLATIAGLALAVAGGSAIAVAAAGQGSVPPREPVARAIHRALSAPAPAGITARITFTDHLIGASTLETSDPLLTGATGRLWLSRGHLRLELQADNGDAQLVVSDGSFWIYDPSSKTVYKGTLPAGMGAKGDSGRAHEHGGGIPSIAEIETSLNRLMAHVGVSGAVPGDIAGRPAYTVTITPKESGGLIGGIALGWDAARGIPLRIAVYARGSSSPVIELKATDISYGPVSPGVFRLSAPSGSHVANVDTSATKGAGSGGGERHGKHAAKVGGYAAVAARVGFRLDAPARLGGLARNSVSLLGSRAHAGALIAYGQGLGTVLVIEQGDRGKTRIAGGQAGNGGAGGGPTLPSVALRGATAQELPTALGTVLRFTRGNVSYTVLGSVPRATAERVARGL